MKIFPSITIKAHIYNGKVSDGKITENVVNVKLNQDAKPVQVKARRSFIGIGNQPVSIEFGLGSDSADGDVLSKVINDLQTTGQDMIYILDKTVPFDAPRFLSSISISTLGKEYYVPLDSQIAKDAIDASGIAILSKMSNQEVIDRVKELI